MTKYIVTHEDYQGGNIGYAGKKTDIITAIDDTDAILQAQNRWGWVFGDDNDVAYGEPGFITPSFDEAKESLIDSNQMGGSGYIYQIENLGNGEIIFKDPNAYDEEDEEYLSMEEAFKALR